MTCSESTDNAVSFSNQEGVTALVTSTGTESPPDQRAAHRPGVALNAGCETDPSTIDERSDPGDANLRSGDRVFMCRKFTTGEVGNRRPRTHVLRVSAELFES